MSKDKKDKKTKENAEEPSKEEQKIDELEQKVEKLEKQNKQIKKSLLMEKQRRIDIEQQLIREKAMADFPDIVQQQMSVQEKSKEEAERELKKKE